MTPSRPRTRAAAARHAPPPEQSLRLAAALRALAFVALVLAAPSDARAQAASSQDDGDAEESGEEKRSGGVGTGITRIAEDTYFETEIGFELEHGEWEVAIAIPLRFRLTDLAPPSSSVIREFDYDEPGDYLGWIRYVEYGRTRFWGLPADPYYGRVGELSRLYVGHGSIVGGYDNIIDFNHKQWGVHFRTNQGIATGEVLLDDILDPGMMGGRVSLRPGALFVALLGRPDPEEAAALDEAFELVDATMPDPTPPNAEDGGAGDGDAGDGGASEAHGDAGGRTSDGVARRDDEGERTDGSIRVGNPDEAETSDEASDEDVAGAADAEEDVVYPWRGLEFGATVVGDIDAPYRLEREPDTLEPVVDRRRNLVVAESAATAFVGFDAQVEAFRNDRVTIIPYTDVNTHLAHGRGAHFGSFVNVTGEEGIRLNSRLEMRAASEGYEPVYFDTSYEAHRFTYQAIGPLELRDPKLRVMDHAPPPNRLGWYADAAIRIRRIANISVGFGDYRGPDNAIMFASVRLRNIGPFRIRAGMSNRDFDRPGDMFDPENLRIDASLQWNIIRYFFVKGIYRREYEARARGGYRPDNQWGVGAGLIIPI